MKNSKFDFKRHQNFKKSYKMLIRFGIYIIVISFLLFLIFNQSSPKNDEKPKEIEVEEIEID